MKHYDLIIIGTGSGMNLIDPYLQGHPGAKIAVIDKDPPGGICLTKGCIPTKMLVYPAEMIRLFTEAGEMGIDIDIKNIDFQSIMQRMHKAVDPEIDNIRASLINSKDLDYYPVQAEFSDSYQLKVGQDRLTAALIVLCIGSRPFIPPIQNLENTNYYTSDTILELKQLPQSIAIVGGGYIAAEYAHFFSAMGSDVTVIGRNRQFLPEEEPEISELARNKMSEYMTILTGHEVIAVERSESGRKEIIYKDKRNGKQHHLVAAEILVAAGRQSNSDLLKPERAGIQVDEKGWIKVDDYLETTKSNIWALGDAVGRHLFKHVANYESRILYYNAILKENVKVDYHAVPHAVFIYPEVAAVGMGEAQAILAAGRENLLIGFQRYQDTAKGEAMGVKDYFVKVIVERPSGRILGAHIIGPQASVLIQEIVTLMYTPDPTINPVTMGMHIHPALSEVVERACMSLMPLEQYQYIKEEDLL